MGQDSNSGLTSEGESLALRAAGRAASTRGATSLVAVLLPAGAMPLVLSLGIPRVPRLLEPGGWPVQLWFIAVAGAAATAAGVLDWCYHRAGHRRIPQAERRAECGALSLGVPLFALLAAASVVGSRHALLVPIVVIALAMAALIAYDETRFHRACTRYETLLHRVLVGGNAIAFLAWLHWCFGRGDSLG